MKFENAAIAKGYAAIAGFDEAGRGALCGPVVASSVILYPNQIIPGVDDSKRLTPGKRDTLFIDIMKSARSVGIGLARAAEIDEINILQATRRAMNRARCKLVIPADYLLLDAITIDVPDIPQQSIIKGDRKSHSIAAASIVAKVVRDRIMMVWHRRYPRYNWKKNKGYGTAAHLSALREYGPTEIHRKTFKGVLTYRGLFDRE